MSTPSNDLNISQPGYVVFDGVSTFTGRTFQAGSGIILTNASGIAGNTTISSTASTTDLHEAKWIVNAIPNSGGNQTTISAAITAASSGETIFVMPGTYTENLTLKPGVNIVAFRGDSSLPTVTIVGTLTHSTAGKASISNIRLQTNSSFLLTVSGSAASVVDLNSCWLNCTNNTGISHTSSSSSSQINLNNCIADLTAPGIAYFSSSSAGNIFSIYSTLLNSGSSTTASTISAAQVSFSYTTFGAPITSSGTAGIMLAHSRCDTGNTTSLTCGGSGTHTFYDCRIISGTATSVVVNSATTMQKCEVDSSNTAAISGSNTLSYSDLSFTSSSNITSTGQTVLNVGPSRTIGSTNSGNTNTLLVTNGSNTASSSANILSRVAGGTAADPTHQSSVSGVTTWTWGIDNSDADSWVLAQGTALGTNNVMRSTVAGEITYPLQPAFFAYLSTGVTNVTGNGTVYTIIFDTEVYDQNGDFNLAASTFTAPVTGKYHFDGQLHYALDTSTPTSGNWTLTTSNLNMRFCRMATALDLSTTQSRSGSVICDMDAADTAFLTLTMTGSTLAVDLNGATSGAPNSFFSGNLTC